MTEPARPCGQQPSRAGWMDEVAPLAGDPEKIIAVDLVPSRPEAAKRLGGLREGHGRSVEPSDGWVEEQRRAPGARPSAGVEVLTASTPSSTSVSTWPRCSGPVCRPQSA